MAKSAKRKATKTILVRRAWVDDRWVVHYGKLKRGQGHPGKTPNLFRCLGEKLPWESLASVKKQLDQSNIPRQGVYIAHDSMGCPRYSGRGNIFGRLRRHGRAHPLELRYFSFYVVED